MNAPRARADRRRLVVLAAAASLGSLTHCGTRTVDAVDLGPAAHAASTPTQATPLPPPRPRPGSPDGGGAPTTGIWPNAVSTANSDPWIAAHHDSLLEMHPRVLVLQFYNGIDPQQTESIALAQIDAIAEGSRYHGYADAGAPAFLQYDLIKVVDLSDHPPPADWQYVSSTRLPTDSSGAFDTNALFTDAFAKNYGFPDPSTPSRYLTLCELFERGSINELWLEVGEEGARAPGLMMESKQVYDDQDHAVPGRFEPCAGYACLPVAPCGVSARVAHLSPVRGLGCDLLVRSAGLENTRLAIPYLQTNALDFINHDFDTRAGMRFASFDDLCGTQQSCVTYPSETVATGTNPDGTSWRMDPFRQGCGTSHFPANARARWDYTNSQSVQSRCEHYGMHDGANGADKFDVYSPNKVDAYTQQVGDDCGGGWQMYLRQSVPGLHNAAFAADGGPMKNWWPFLFY
jgi:hypothetical protein